MTRALPLLIGLLLLPASVQAQDPSIQVAVRLGLTSGDLRSGWVPVEVLLDNHGSAREVEVILTVEQNDREFLTFNRLVPLADKRREWFSLPFKRGSGTFEVEVRSVPDDPEEEESKLLANSSQSFSVKEESGSLSYRGLRMLYVGGRPETARRDAVAILMPKKLENTPHLEVREPAHLPNRAIHYQAIDLVVLHDANLADMSKPQLDALDDWVHGGGTLLLIPSRRLSWFESSPIRRLLRDVQVERRKIDRMPQLERRFGRISNREPFNLYLFKLPDDWPKPESQKDLEDEEYREALEYEDELGPLIERLRYGKTYDFLQEAPMGRGRILLLAADPSLAPFSRWRGRKGMTRALYFELRRRVGEADRVGVNRPNPFVDFDLIRALDSTIDPDRTLVVALVIIYILCVGPINFHLMRRYNRPLLIAISVPSVALLFSVMVIGSGYLTKGLSTEVWRVSVISTRFGSDHGLEQTAISLRPSDAANYAIDMEAPLVGTRVFRSNSILKRSSLDILDRGGTKFPAVPLDMWELAVVEGYAQRDLKGGIHVEWDSGGPVISNRTPYALRRTVVVRESGHIYRVDRVEAGERRRAKRVGKLDSRKHELYQRVSEELFEEEREAELAERTLELYESTLAETREPVVVGLLERPPSKVTIDGEERSDMEVCLLVASGEER